MTMQNNPKMDSKVLRGLRDSFIGWRLRQEWSVERIAGTMGCSVSSIESRITTRAALKKLHERYPGSLTMAEFKEMIEFYNEGKEHKALIRGYVPTPEKWTHIR